jgi:hypothetical protein
MPLLFGLAFLAIGFGGMLAMGGQHLQNLSDEARLERELPVYDAQQAALKAQLKDLEAKKVAAQQMTAITETQIARQGAQAVGSVRATAGAGNVGGASVLRREMGIERQVGEEITKQDIQLKSNLGELGVASLRTSAELLKSNVEETNVRADLEFLRRYGWMSVVGQGLSAVARGVNVLGNAPAANTAPAPLPSLATENFNYENAYDYAYNWNFGT